MSILINLLPDIRQAKLRERRRRQLASGLAVLVWVVCGGVIVVMSLVTVGQKAVIAGYNKSITENKQKLEGVTGLIDALTAEQHLAALPGLYDKRVYLTKFLTAYGEANPNDILVSSMTVDAQNSLVVSGTGKSYAAVAKLARTLEASNVLVGTGAAPNNTPYFSNVNITSVSNSSGQSVAFTMGATLASGVVSGTE